MNRRQVRYWLFRFKTEEEGGCEASESPEGLREAFECLPSFKFAGGWKSFGVTWDVQEEDPFEIMPLDESLWDAWHKHCESAAKEFPKKVREVIRAERPDFEDNEEVEIVLNIH